MKHPLLSTFAVAGAVCALGAPSSAEAQVPPPSWVRQLGANIDEQAQAVAVSGNSVYVVGHTSSQLGPEPKAGGLDVFLAKYDTAGTLQWVHQLGTAQDDRATAVATDAAGNVYVTGHTFGGFGFYANAGGLDYFVTQYDAQGNQQWLRQNGTQMDDFATGIAVADNDKVFISGYTGGSFANGGNPNNYDIIVALYDDGGNPYWLQQLGSPSSDMARGIAVTSTYEVYVVGNTFGSLDGVTTPVGTDIFLMKLDILGTQQWVRQVDSSDLDDAKGVAVSADGGVYIAGETFGTLDGNTNNGLIDVLLARYDASGNREWSRLLGGTQTDYAFGVAVAPNGTVQVTGYTTASLDGNAYAGSQDVFLSRFDAFGSKIGTRTLGTNRSDIGRGVAVDASGNTYVTGFTFGGLAGNPSAGGYDAFLCRF
ncbi:SBBP repeat-containing protein [Myxococcus sp. CA051A]|uniref:SBBP repeat-containing protein n=1 Tax=Myxococcus sp. CA051A TaxID=2741739 RepID=UPI00157A4470|nr:SBBP repeat-containing protein [Myxococcus sp. CA051A]NTX61413.1 SBBP repeat-containing protein [Myxococcus sp. CA051A]